MLTKANSTGLTFRLEVQYNATLEGFSKVSGSHLTVNFNFVNSPVSFPARFRSQIRLAETRQTLVATNQIIYDIVGLNILSTESAVCICYPLTFSSVIIFIRTLEIPLGQMMTQFNNS